MSTQTLDHIPDIDLDFDIEEELADDEHSHALPFCHKHKTREFFPVAGSIVQAICGALFRVKYLFSNVDGKKRCEKCANHHGKLNCFYCGVEVYG